MLKNVRPVWAEIYLDRLANNIKEVLRLIRPETLVMAVVKGDAYGHGAVMTSKIFLENGAERLGVATLTEAIELRNAGIKVPILVLGYTPSYQSDLLLSNDITQAIYTFQHAKALSQGAKLSGAVAKIHIKIDTGLGRLGFLPTNKSIDTITKINQLPALEIEGIFSHFAIAGNMDKSYTNKQFDKFEQVVEELEARDVDISIKHVANSATITNLPEYHLDMVRPGGILYGLHHSEANEANTKIQRAMVFKTTISNIKTVPKGTGIGYGLTFMTERRSQIGTIPVGYADGYSRALSNQGEVSIKGERCPVIGNVCMDQCMIDLTDRKYLEIGDEVILFGDGDKNTPRAEDVAKWMKSNVAEVVTHVGRRVPRVYIKESKVVDVVDYLMQ